MSRVVFEKIVHSAGQFVSAGDLISKLEEIIRFSIVSNFEQTTFSFYFVISLFDIW